MNYFVKVTKEARYHGETSENFKKGQIHTEVYEFRYKEYKEALDAYIERCIESAQFLSLPISQFTQKNVIQLIDNTEKNPSKNHEHLSLLVRELTISNL